MPKVLNYRVIIEQDEDGIFVASLPTLQGCYTEGDTFEEAIKNIQDVIKLHLDARKTRGLLPDDSNTEFVGIKNLSIPYGISFHN
ncbi:type II toxin-antitoxin system HicB family antitoxin [Candidatus Roizmanbacteria bacterium]|nr:type II toxin-antitoxin system HicB family antitoxin [Candidatus Roizmanbacteria bacterium]